MLYYEVTIEEARCVVSIDFHNVHFLVSYLPLQLNFDVSSINLCVGIASKSFPMTGELVGYQYDSIGMLFKSWV